MKITDIINYVDAARDVYTSGMIGGKQLLIAALGDFVRQWNPSQYVGDLCGALDELEELGIIPDPQLIQVITGMSIIRDDFGCWDVAARPILA